MPIFRLAVAVVVFGLCRPVTAHAQAIETIDVPDRFVVDAGGFNMFVDTALTLRAPRIDFEQDLSLPDNVRRGYIEAFVRLARRHQVSVSYGSLERGGDGTSLSRDISWGGITYQTGLTVEGRTESHIFNGAYRLALYKTPRVELGPAIGFGYMWLTAGIKASGSVNGQPGDAVERTAEENTPTGDVGGFFNWWMARRVRLRSDLRYIVVKPGDSEAAVAQARAGVTWYPWPHLGFGGQYSFDKLRYDRGLLSTTIGGAYTYQGIQILASAAF